MDSSARLVRPGPGGLELWVFELAIDFQEADRASAVKSVMQLKASLTALARCRWPDCQLAAGPDADCMPAGQLAFPGSEAPVRDPLALSPADGRRSVRPALRPLAERGAGDEQHHDRHGLVVTCQHVNRVKCSGSLEVGTGNHAAPL